MWDAENHQFQWKLRVFGLTMNLHFLLSYPCLYQPMKPCVTSDCSQNQTWKEDDKNARGHAGAKVHLNFKIKLLASSALRNTWVGKLRIEKSAWSTACLSRLPFWGVTSLGLPDWTWHGGAVWPRVSLFSFPSCKNLQNARWMGRLSDASSAFPHPSVSGRKRRNCIWKYGDSYLTKMLHEFNAFWPYATYEVVL